MTREATKEQLLAELAALCGIEPHYYDNAGNLHVTASTTQESLLTAMGCRCLHFEELCQEVERRRQFPWTALVEPVLAICQSQLPSPWHLYLPFRGEALPQLEIHWELVAESGSCCHQQEVQGTWPVLETRSFNGLTYGRLALPLPAALGLGYYQLNVGVQAGAWFKEGQMLVVIAPDQVYLPEILTRQRLWGLNLPLYALASRRNWGIGDCGDLQNLIHLAAKLEADIIGLNPLHHLGPWLADSVSPYYPTSRCFADPLYLDLEQAPELAVSQKAQEYLASPEWQEQIIALRHGRRVNYPVVARLKQAVLAELSATFVEHHGTPESPKTERGREFAAFLAQRGKLLEDFSTFLALADYWQEQQRPGPNWQDWPAAYHDPDGPAVKAFQHNRRMQVLCHSYAQWLLAGQMHRTQQQARQEGLALGLYLDLAVGVNPGGFDAWRQQHIFASTVDIGAPPDDFSPLGQNWHLAPLSPLALRDQGYRYVIDVLRQNCLNNGALRIDHVMGLFRLYWIPQGASAAQGAYVRYPAAEMLKILALESLRQQTVIIGEDLGTVPPTVREELAALGIFSTRLFYFERRNDGSCLPADQYPEQAQAAITTHDLPTLTGFWQGRDIQVRQELHLFPDSQTRDRALAERHRTKAAILALLSSKGWLTPEVAAQLAEDAELPDAVRWGVITHLAETPCRLVLLSLEDIFGWPDQQNLPGTKDEYPNWRLKLPLFLEDIAKAPEPQQAAEIMRRCQRGGSRGKE